MNGQTGIRDREVPSIEILGWGRTEYRWPTIMGGSQPRGPEASRLLETLLLPPIIILHSTSSSGGTLLLKLIGRVWQRAQSGASGISKP